MVWERLQRTLLRSNTASKGRHALQVLCHYYSTSVYRCEPLTKSCFAARRNAPALPADRVNKKVIFLAKNFFLLYSVVEGADPTAPWTDDHRTSQPRRVSIGRTFCAHLQLNAQQPPATAASVTGVSQSPIVAMLWVATDSPVLADVRCCEVNCA